MYIYMCLGGRGFGLLFLLLLLMILLMVSRLEKHMLPTSESTKLESSGEFVEYVGCEKLKDKKVLVTGGEYVPPSSFRSSLLILSGGYGHGFVNRDIVPESAAQ
jgi:hypothetical protein